VEAKERQERRQESQPTTRQGQEGQPLMGRNDGKKKSRKRRSRVQHSKAKRSDHKNHTPKRQR